MGRVEATANTLRSFRERFPDSLVGTWSTFGDGYQMEFGHTATFYRDGTGVFDIWSIFEEEEPERSSPFLWNVKERFEVEVRQAPSGTTICASDYGSFVVEFYISEDPYGIKSIAIRDARAHEGREPFWWFMDPERHPMRLLIADEQGLRS